MRKAAEGVASSDETSGIVFGVSLISGDNNMVEEVRCTCKYEKNPIPISTHNIIRKKGEYFTTKV
jgi:hypothetical protein